MKLGEAKYRLQQIDWYLKESLAVISVGPLADVGGTLDKCNEVLAERRNLLARVALTESQADVGGESLTDVVSALDTIGIKIPLLEKIAARGELSPSQRGVIFKQLQAYRETRDTLGLSIDKCLWEFELTE